MGTAIDPASIAALITAAQRRQDVLPALPTRNPAATRPTGDQPVPPTERPGETGETGAKGAFAAAIPAIISAVGGIAQGLLAEDPEEDRRKTTEAAANARAFQQLMQLLLAGGTGR